MEADRRHPHHQGLRPGRHPPAGRQHVLHLQALRRRGRAARPGPGAVLEQSPALSGDRHDRCRPGLNHLAFHVASRAEVEALVERASANGWTLMFPDRHPYAGGEHHYAAYLEDGDGFEIELVAQEPVEP
ncbi:VOC family protein [Nonomuraea angiospora]|uniref:VOC family protein n=1 Tax=Nonomuraea angiospora TaxID=46172 RepID=UPI0029BD5F13|nr:VOC family protein [Nonomuraea angiospora]MDX3101556.1 VOC family protein [Nonomuraea angiospora]